MDLFLPGPPMVDMLLPTVDMLPPAMDTLLSEPTTVDTSFRTEGPRFNILLRSFCMEGIDRAEKIKQESIKLSMFKLYCFDEQTHKHKQIYNQQKPREILACNFFIFVTSNLQIEDGSKFNL